MGVQSSSSVALRTFNAVAFGETCYDGCWEDCCVVCSYGFVIWSFGIRFGLWWVCGFVLVVFKSWIIGVLECFNTIWAVYRMFGSVF